VGYLDVSDGPDSLYEQAQLRVRWLPSPKLHLAAQGGVEDRHIRSDTQPSTLVNPVFDVSVAYRPTEATEFSVRADRAVRASYFLDQLEEPLRIEGIITQRLARNLYLLVNGAMRGRGM